jgi:hypothetical protein
MFTSASPNHPIFDKVLSSSSTRSPIKTNVSPTNTTIIADSFLVTVPPNIKPSMPFLVTETGYPRFMVRSPTTIPANRKMRVVPPSQLPPSGFRDTNKSSTTTKKHIVASKAAIPTLSKHSSHHERKNSSSPRDRTAVRNIICKFEKVAPTPDQNSAVMEHNSILRDEPRGRRAKQPVKCEEKKSYSSCQDCLQTLELQVEKQTLEKTKLLTQKLAECKLRLAQEKRELAEEKINSRVCIKHLQVQLKTQQDNSYSFEYVEELETEIEQQASQKGALEDLLVEYQGEIKGLRAEMSVSSFGMERVRELESEILVYKTEMDELKQRAKSSEDLEEHMANYQKDIDEFRQLSKASSRERIKELEHMTNYRKEIDKLRESVDTHKAKRKDLENVIAECKTKMAKEKKKRRKEINRQTIICKDLQDQNTIYRKELEEYKQNAEENNQSQPSVGPCKAFAALTLETLEENKPQKQNEDKDPSTVLVGDAKQRSSIALTSPQEKHPNEPLGVFSKSKSNNSSSTLDFYFSDDEEEGPLHFQTSAANNKTMPQNLNILAVVSSPHSLGRKVLLDRPLHTGSKLDFSPTPIRRKPSMQRGKGQPSGLKDTGEVKTDDADAISVVLEVDLAVKSKGEVRWSKEFEVQSFISMMHESINSTVSGLFYTDDEIAEFRYDAHCEACGVDPNEFR